MGMDVIHLVSHIPILGPTCNSWASPYLPLPKPKGAAFS